MVALRGWLGKAKQQGHIRRCEKKPCGSCPPAFLETCRKTGPLAAAVKGAAVVIVHSRRQHPPV